MKPGNLLRRELLPAGPLVVAVSAGLDSMVLLHQLRFVAGRGADVTVAHLDHAMRPGSDRDAAWLRGVCRAWDLPLISDQLASSPASEEAARDARYRFLESVRARCGASAVAVAHHADDQAETVLFRVLRGTGVRGLTGMAPARDGIVRPLLDRWRGELSDYARRHGVPHREDPTNRDPSFARNALRHQIIPMSEARVARGSRLALVRLAENAARTGEEMAALEALLFREMVRLAAPGRAEVPAEALDSLPVPLRRRLIRAACRRLGVTLSRTTTDLAVDAVGRLGPGHGLDLTGGLRLERGGRMWIFMGPGAAPGLLGSAAPLEIQGTEPGEGELTTVGARYRVAWGHEASGTPGEVALADPGLLPLTFRGWAPGDRIRLEYGSKAVGRLLGERGVPRVDRPAAAVCLDPDGSVLWVPGVAESHDIVRTAGLPGAQQPLFLTCDRLADA